MGTLDVKNLHETKPADVARWLPARVNASGVNKSTFGHVLVIGGSVGLQGAPILAAHAAARSGAGLVTLAMPQHLESMIVSRLSPVVMTLPLPATSDTLAGSAAEDAIRFAKQGAIVAVGPGLGKGPDVSLFVQGFLRGCESPAVVDADALNALAEYPDRGVSLIKNRSAPTVLTPHPKELARLLAVTVDDVQADRHAAVRSAAKAYGCIIILKGHQTLVAEQTGYTYLNPTGNPGMATAGTGDVLTGIVAALLAQKLEPLQAAAAGAYIHGLAGDLAMVEIGGSTGMLATDLIQSLPPAIRKIQ